MKARELDVNVFKYIGDKWCLISARKDDGTFNMMTASWGGLGVLWNKDVATIYIRPTRYTKEFVDESDYFTLTFFPEDNRKPLHTLGAKSGRDINKIEDSGYTPLVDDQYVDYKESILTIKCKKIYVGQLDPKNFVDETIEELYPLKDYHAVYIGEILDINHKE